jgi:uncharacterized protein (TIGR02594 family)
MKKIILIVALAITSFIFTNTAQANPHNNNNNIQVTNTKKVKKIKKQKVEQPPKIDIRQIKLNEMMAIYNEDSSGGFFALEKAREEFRNVKMIKVKKPEIKPVQYAEDSSNDLVQRASKYLGFGPNQLGLPRNLWCADFINMLVGGHSRAAASYLSRGTYAKYGCVNCVAVLKRRGGNHVGVVSGYDADGDPIIISGNHNGVVGIGVYRREKVIGYRVI